MLSSRNFAAYFLLISLLVIPSVVHAQEPGDNILTKTGVISNLSGSSPFIKYIPIRIPEIGKAYEVKINFFKVETSAAAVDAYIDHLNEQAKARGEGSGSAKWDELRAKLKEVVSSADFEVIDPAGDTIGRASDLGATTFFRTVKFVARGFDYKIKLRCASGAGAYLLVLEWD